MKTTFIEMFPNSEACQVLACLPEKFIVDFANGIDVIQDHVRQQKERSFFQRIKEGLSGRASQRQQAINASLLDGMEASLNWLTELTTSLATTNYALAQVNDRVTRLTQETAVIAHYSADTREQLKLLAMQVNRQLNHLEQQFRRVDLVQRGQLHLDHIFSIWQAGRYSHLPLAGRCYVALEELRWGDFGEVIRHGEPQQANQLLDILKNRAVVQLADDHKSHPLMCHDTRSWLAFQGEHEQHADWNAAINWLADWCNPESHPIIWSTTQKYDSLPIRMPRLCSAERIAGAMVDEVFTKELVWSSQ
ncbi:MAG: diguanylate cyclase regulator RdcB family protein [Plesiomonas shigelloides]